MLFHLFNFHYKSYILLIFIFFFFFNDTATTEIYTLSLHDALPISGSAAQTGCAAWCWWRPGRRSEEHTSELQSRPQLVCRLLLEKKKKHMLHSLLLIQKKQNNQIIQDHH